MKVKEGEVEADILAFLTCEPNAIVAPIHPKAMPVIPTTQGDSDGSTTSCLGVRLVVVSLDQALPLTIFGPSVAPAEPQFPIEYILV